MYEVKKIYEEMSWLETNEKLLKLAQPKYSVPYSTVVFFMGLATDSTVLLTFSLILAGGPIIPLLKDIDINHLKKANEEAYFNKASQLHKSVRRAVYWAFFFRLKNEHNPQKRKEIINSILWMKKIDTIRQADKKEVMRLWGHKRKGLARGLKYLRSHIGKMTFDEYVEKRQNILSYY